MATLIHRKAWFLLISGLLSLNVLAQDNSLFRSGVGERIPLPREQAFPFFVSETDSGHYQVTWEIAPQHYLYRHGFRVGFKPAATIQDYELAYSIPAGISKVDQFFGRVEVYYDRVVVDVPSVPAAEAGAELIIEFQGCAEWGFCYPPQRIPYPLLPQ